MLSKYQIEIEEYDNNEINYLKNKKITKNKEIKNFFESEIFRYTSKDEKFFNYIDKK